MDNDRPEDPVSELVAEAMSEILLGTQVEVLHERAGSPQTGDLESHPQVAAVTNDDDYACATGTGPPGWNVQMRIRLSGRPIPPTAPGGSLLLEMVRHLPEAGILTAAKFRSTPPSPGTAGVGLPALRRAIRDTLAAQILSDLIDARFDGHTRPGLIDETIDYLIELGGSRVEATDLTHGIIITDAVIDEPRLNFEYPADVRSAKRAPLLFDGYRSILVVDPHGRARTELQRHRLDNLASRHLLAQPRSVTGTEPDDSQVGRSECWDPLWGADGSSLAAEVTGRLGGLALILESDRTIRAFIDGEPLLVRRGEHWTAFPLELGGVIGMMIEGGTAADLVVDTALAISSGRHGAILAVVADSANLDDIVPLKDRFDLRNEIDPHAMVVETRLHHLIDAGPLDALTLTRLAMLDGATIINRDSDLIAYGAIVASSDSQNEGARTAAARTLSTRADVVLRVSADGDITIFRSGAALTTLLGNPNQHEDRPSGFA
ncbi:MAG: diadenylate cyclase [Microthrixaceae bacterium]|nr:diadenylate cyclase [Microthrixaceae bacterium]